MTTPSLSVCADDLGSDVRAALDCARELQFRVVDLGATQGAVSPRELSRTGQRHLLKHLSDLGLRLGSLRGPVGGAGYADGTLGEQRLETMRGVIRLASSLRVPVVSTAPGRILGIDAEAVRARLREALCVLADDADRAGVRVAVESAGASVDTIRALLAELNCPWLSACCDSGAMLMQGEDPHRLGETLAGRIQLVRARDAVRGSFEAPGCEVAVGEGELDVPRFLAALTASGFYGDIVLSRAGGEDRTADLVRARSEFLRHLR